MSNLETASQDEIIYDDAELRVIWTAGSSKYAVISFGDLITRAEGTKYFADTPLKKSGITSVGVVAKRANWYPAENMRSARQAILSRVAHYRTLVSYGGSMGGYAAVKYSSLLGVSHVISLCPQWSIDPEECNGANPGWQNHFQARLRGMGVRPEDVGGKVYVFSDPHDGRDAFHTSRLSAICPSITTIAVPLVSHHVTPVLSGTRNLVRLIDMALSEDSASIRKFVKTVRRSNGIWRTRALEVGSQKFPNFTSRVQDKCRSN